MGDQPTVSETVDLGQTREPRTYQCEQTQSDANIPDLDGFVA